MAARRTKGHERFKRWCEWVGKQEDVATRLGCYQATISKLVNVERGVSVHLAAQIERESADWPEGAIQQGEWAELAPEAIESTAEPAA